MKLIAVLGIEEYKKKINRLFAEIKIPVFSEMEVKGYQNLGAALDGDSNWFSDHSEYVYSVINFAFVPDNAADEILEKIKALNDQKAFERPLHAFQLDVEKYI